MVSSGVVMNSNNVVCRNPPGTKSEDFYKWPAQKFDEMDSTLAVQQYIQQSIREDFKDIDRILTVPDGQDEGVWKYEHLRQFCLELNGLAVKLQSECTAETCSQMTATEQWIFLCAAHKTPKECPAIDYTRHTLDGAACLLNSNKYFPSRVSIKESSVAKLGSVCRRVYRIFSHAYYHHRQIFDEAENETYLCRRFTSFVIKYNLMSQDNLIVPIFNSSDESASQDNVENTPPNPISIAKKPVSLPGITSFLDLPEGVVPDDEAENPIEINFPEVDSTSLGSTDLYTATLEDDDNDDEFSYSDNPAYGTLKPAKEDSSSQQVAEESSGEPTKLPNTQESEMNETVLSNPDIVEEKKVESKEQKKESE